MLTQNQINEFTKRARIAGLSDSQIQQEIARKVAEFDQGNGLSQPQAVSKPNLGSRGGTTPQTDNFASSFVSTLAEPSSQAPKSVEGFAGNVGKSLFRNLGDMLSAAINALNPNLDENTIANIGRLGIDAVKLATGDKDEANRARNLVEFYKQRYGEDLETTLYEDPIGVLLDISTVLSGATTVVKGAGAVSKSARLAKAANTLEKASIMTDPVAQAGKLATNTVSGALKYTKVADKVAETTQGIRQSIADEAARRSLRANPPQMERFQELIGTADEPGDIGRWMNENGIRTKEDVVSQIKTKQEEYNALVRTDKPISGQVFAEKLIKRAEEIEKSDISPSAQALAAKLRDEAERVAKLENVTDTILTNSKTSQFSKVSKKAMTDPLTDNFNKEYGSVALQTLDEIAPGSAQVGKELQVLREFDGIVSKQRNLGKGSQLINIFKPAFTGLTGGYILSGGNVAGAIASGTVASLMTNPYFLKSSAKLLTEGIELPEKVTAGMGKAIKTAAKTGRLSLKAEEQGTTAPTESNPEGTNTSLLGPNQSGYQGTALAGTMSYDSSLSQARRDAVQGLISLGVTDPQTQLELLNYDEDGNKVGDFTIGELASYQAENERYSDTNSIIPSTLNPFGGLSKRQVLALALSKGASMSDLKEVGELYDTFAGNSGTVSAENMKIADSLRSEYFQRTKENGFLEISQAYKKVSATSETAAGDLSLIYGYMKLLDPSSVVRETEASMVQNASSFGGKVENAVSRVVSGKPLNSKQREEFRREAAKQFDIYRSQQATIDAFYQGQARRYGVDPSLVGIGLYSQN